MASKSRSVIHNDKTLRVVFADDQLIHIVDDKNQTLSRFGGESSSGHRQKVDPRNLLIQTNGKDKIAVFFSSGLVKMFNQKGELISTLKKMENDERVDFVFGRVESIAFCPNNFVAVVDSISRQVFIFDSTFLHVHTIGIFCFNDILSFPRKVFFLDNSLIVLDSIRRFVFFPLFGLTNP